MGSTVAQGDKAACARARTPAVAVLVSHGQAGICGLV